MAIKTILVSLNDTQRLEDILRAASRLALTFDAHVVGLLAIPAVQVYPTGGIDLMPQVYEGTRIHFKKQAVACRETFEAAMKRDVLKFSYVEVDSTSTLISDTVIDYARSADLVMIMNSSHDDANWIEGDFAERIVIAAGRPVLILPRKGHCEINFGEAIVGWNGSREAARAAFDAVPILMSSRAAHIVTVDPSSDPALRGKVAGADLATSLARHSINAIAEPYQTGGQDPGRALLQHAHEIGANLIVAGAYGHSRLREFILGGSTREILRNMDRPVLMSH
jgi:nucleotide-binding universal stress UspA family protein